MKEQVLNKSVCRHPCLSCVACKLHLFCAASPVACLTLSYFPTLSHKRRELRENKV